MGDHGDDIPEFPSPLHDMEDEEFNPTFDPSPDIPTHYGFDTSHDRPTHSRYDPSFTGHWYWMSGDETHHEPMTTSYISYGMSSIPVHDSTHHAESEFEPNTTPGAL